MKLNYLVTFYDKDMDDEVFNKIEEILDAISDSLTKINKYCYSIKITDNSSVSEIRDKITRQCKINGDGIFVVDVTNKTWAANSVSKIATYWLKAIW